jgi:hypothetical protein
MGDNKYKPETIVGHFYLASYEDVTLADLNTMVEEGVSLEFSMLSPEVAEALSQKGKEISIDDLDEPYRTEAVTAFVEARTLKARWQKLEAWINDPRNGFSHENAEYETEWVISADELKLKIANLKAGLE